MEVAQREEYLAQDRPDPVLVEGFPPAQPLFQIHPVQKGLYEVETVFLLEVVDHHRKRGMAEASQGLGLPAEEFLRLRPAVAQGLEDEVDPGSPGVDHVIGAPEPPLGDEPHDPVAPRDLSEGAAAGRAETA